jgi:hypothetical protein
LAGVLLPQVLVQQLNPNANPISGSAWYFYLTGTTTPAVVYADAALATPLSNPVVADSSGRMVNIYLDPTVVYRLKIFSAAGGTLIRDIDPANSLFADNGLANVNPEVGRSALGGNGQLSLGDVAANADASINVTNYTAIAQRCADEGKVLWVPYGTGLINGTLDIDGTFDIDGPGTLRTTGINAPMIRMTVGGGGIAHAPIVKNVTFFNDLNSTTNQNSCAIEITGNNTYILYPQFDNVTTYGCYASVVNNCGTFNGPFGDESYINWASFKSCRTNNHTVSANAKYQYWCKHGSGTGTTFQDCKGELGYPMGPMGAELIGRPAYCRVDGIAGEVAGDIIFEGDPTGLETFCISVDGGLNYRTNINVAPTTQIDARMQGAVIYDPPASYVIGAQIRPLAVGGLINIARGLPDYLIGSRLDSQGFHEAKGGGYSNAFTTGAQTQEVCRLTLPTSTLMEVELFASGLVGGRGRGGRKKVYSLLQDGATVVPVEQTALGYTHFSSGSTGMPDFSHAVLGDEISFAMTLDPTVAGTELAWQYRVIGGIGRTELGGTAP